MYPTSKKSMVIDRITSVSLKKSLLVIAQLIFLFNYLFAQTAPTISSFSPLSAKPGDAVTITGTNFSTTANNNIVFFGATIGTVTSASATSLTVTVPTGAMYAPITVLNTGNGLQANSNRNFNPVFTPNKSSITSSDFLTKVDFTTGTAPSSVAIGDIDGDGKPDLVTTNSGSNRVSVFLNTSSSGTISSSSFATKVDFTTGTAPSSVAIGDIDGDGKPDLAVANNSSSSVSIFQNTSSIGSISFNNKVDFTIGNSPQAVAFGDIDGDGKPDLVTANSSSNSISLLRNTTSFGSLSFATKVDFTLGTGSSPDAVAIGDLDGDSKPDIAVVNNGNNTVSVFRNTATSGAISSSSLAARVNFTTGTNPQSIALGDLDGDGKTDMAVANNGSNRVSVFRNTATSGTISSSSFANKVDFVTGSGSVVPQAVAISDLNGDGKPDLAVTSSGNTGGNIVSLFSNTSTLGTITTSSFAAKVDFGTGTFPISLAIGDLDGDGRPDLATTNMLSNTVSVLRNNLVFNNADLSNLTISAGSLSPAFDAATTTYSDSVNNSTTVINVTATLADYAASMRVRINGGSYTTLTNAVASSNLALNEGINTINVLVTAPNGTTTKTYTISVFRAYTITVISSFSPNSAKPGDIVTITGVGFNTTPSNNIVFFGATMATVNTASATSLTVTVPVGATYAPITLLNTASTLSASSNGIFTPIYAPAKTSITTSDFAAKVDFTTGTGSNPQAIAIGDIDGDGKPDLVVANTNPSGNPSSVAVFRNTSTSGVIASGSFAAKVDIPTGPLPQSIAIGDLDGDGKPDLATANLDNTVSIFRNISTAGSITSSSFAAKVDFATGSIPYSLAIGDLDGDGKPDLAVANSNGNTVSILRNTSITGAISGSSFAAKVDFAAGTGSRSVAIGDLDGDGKPDLAVANITSNTVSVLRNISTTGAITTGSFAAKVDFAIGSGPRTVVIGDLDGDGKPDLATANSSSNTVSVLLNTSIVGAITSSSFATSVDFVTNSPFSLATGDLDGDGRPDLAITNGNAISVLRNTSITGAITTSSFAVKVDFAVGSFPYSLAIGDLDGDGKPDLAAANYSSNTVSILRNTSNNANLSAIAISSGTLSPAFATNTTSYTANVTNATTIMTITPTVEDANATVQVRVNNGSYASVSSGSASGALALNVGSNTIDVLVTAQNATTKTYTITVTRISNNANLSALTISSGTLSPAFASATTAYTASVTYTTTSVTVTPTVADATATVQVRVNSGTYATVSSGSASGALTLNVGSNTIDVNVTAQDGTTVKTYTITVTRQVPPTITSFTPLSAVPGTSVTITGTNFNTTAANNIVFFGATMATVTAASATSLTVTVPVGATYAPITVLNTASSLSASSNGNFTPTYVPAKTSITTSDFATKVDFTTGTGTYPQSVTIGDLDGDGKPDLALVNTSGNTVSIFRNTSSTGTISSSSFAAKVDFATGLTPYSVAISDLDGDGKPDLVVANRSDNSVSILRNISSAGIITTSSFISKVDFATNMAPCLVAIGDLDGDGKPDLAVANSSNNSISVLRNNSTTGIITSSSFDSKVDIITSANVFSVAIGDLDGDGKPDLVAAVPGFSVVSVFRNIASVGSIASSSFASKVDFSTGSSPRSLAIGDLDGDNKPDLIVVNGSANSVSVLRNNSTTGTITASSFEAKVDFAIGATPTLAQFIAICDLDGNGKPDLAVVNSSSNSVSVLRNNFTTGSINSNSFDIKVDFTTGIGSNPYSVAIGDLDGDGKPDLAVANNNYNAVSILRNTSNNANLSALTINSGTLSPTFASGTTSYTASVSNATTSITVTPTVADATATVQVRVNSGAYATVSSGNASGSLALNVGSNTIDVLVTSQNATTKTYTITVTRAVATPVINSFTGTNGPVGTLVTITGSDLSNPTTITIGGVSAIPISNTGTSLVAMVMPGATTGVVSVTTAGGTANSTSNFIVSSSQSPNAQQGNKLVGTGNVGSAYQGMSVSLSADGNTAIVGGYQDNSAQGAAWIYTRNGGVWSQQGNKLVGTGNVGSAQQGMSVSLSADGNTAIVGGYQDNSAQGAVWIFTRSGNTWSQQGNKLVGTGNVGIALQGVSVSLSADGNTAIVGGYQDNSAQGAAWIFTRSGNIWSQQGNKLVGTGSVGQLVFQGMSVSLSADGNTAIVGGPYDNNSQGAAWIFTRSGNAWSQQGSKLVGTGNIGTARQGQSVSLSADGNTAIVGGYQDNNSQGAAWIFTRSGNTWSQQGNKLVATGNVLAGYSVGISADGNTAIIAGASIDASAWVFTRSGSVWSPLGNKLTGTGNIGSTPISNSVSLSADGNTAIVGLTADNNSQGASWIYTAQPTTWNGTSWSNGAPTTNIDAIIASSIAPASFECKSLTINSGVSLTTTGITATVNGDIINNGNGISGTGGLTIAANSAISGNTLNFNGTLTVNSAATLTTNNLLTLISNATNTARVANSAGNISGNVTVQRYIPGGRRAFRFLSHPFNSSLTLSSLTDNIDVTGTGGSPMTTTATNAPSAFAYDNTSGNSSLGSDPGWTGLTASSTFDAKTGYRILIRGSKGQAGSLTGGTYTPDPVTLDWTGALNQGNQVVTLTNNGTNRDYTLLGNPYASPVDLSLTTRGSNINANFSVWNANAGSRGAYVTQPFSTSYILPSGGAFFTQSSANTNNTITFTESSKSSGTPSSVFRTTTSDEVLTLEVKDNAGNYADQLMFLFNNDHYTTAYDVLWDGNKLVNPEVNFYSMSSDATKLAIDRRPKDTAAIKLGFTASTMGNYSFEVKSLSIGSGNMYYLRDKYLNTETLLQANTTVSFAITSDASTQGDNRFEIVMRSSNALPATFLNVTAAQKNAGIELSWNTANETNMSNYEVEESKDGVTFTKATTVAAKNATTNNYTWLDVSVINGENYYRIKAVENNGTVKYSNVVKVKIGGKGAEFTVYPNPVKGGVIGLQMSNVEKGIYTVKIVNSIGQELANKTINHNGGSATQTIDLGKAIAQGTYGVQISNGTTVITKTIIVE